MITLMRTTEQSGAFKATVIFNCDVRATLVAARPANHNLTREARHSNVVLLGGYHSEPDFRPDMGARVALAA